MNILKKNRVFFDSSVLIAGLASPEGASGMLLALSEMGLIIPVISEQVVIEVIRNIEKKMPRHLPHYYKLFKILPFELADPTDELIKRAEGFINQKDTVILAAAMNSNIDYLVSLDKHFLNDNLTKLPFTVCSPGELIKKIRAVPNH